MRRQLISSGSKWEPLIGYSRAVRAGDMVFVAGTTAANPDGSVIAPGDAYEQTRAVIRRIERALQEAGATLDDVIQTRMYVTDIGRWEEIGRAHGEVFQRIRPAATMVEVKQLIDPEMLIEIEAIAIIGSSRDVEQASQPE